MFIFVGILLIGLVYVWKKGDLNWIRPELSLPVSPSKIPLSAYEHLNAENYQTKAFNIDSEIAIPERNVIDPAVSSIKPGFTPKFKRPAL